MRSKEVSDVEIDDAAVRVEALGAIPARCDRHMVVRFAIENTFAFYHFRFALNQLSSVIRLLH